MAKTVSLINMKGGVGKSTLTVNLAWHFAGYTRQWDKKVLVVDLDPQFNASQYLLGVHKYKQMLRDRKPTIWHMFEQFTRVPGKTPTKLNPHDVIRQIVSFTDGAKIDLIPSTLELAFSLRNPGHKAALLQKTLAPLKDEYDLILIDCAPTESVLTMAAYLASEYVLVPVKPEYLSSIGLPLLVNSMDLFGDEFDHPGLNLAGVVFNGTANYSPEEHIAKSEVKAVAKKNSWYVFKSEVPYSRSFPKGAREGQPLFKTSYSHSKVAGRFAAFAEEFAKRITI